MKRRIAIFAVLATATALSTGANAQSFNGTYDGTATTTTTDGSSSTQTTGDSTVAPFQNTTTTTTDQTVASTTVTTTEAVSATVNGTTYAGSVDFSGTGQQQQTLQQSITTTYDPGPPPTVISTVANPDVITPGASTITAVSASGQIGNADLYAATLSTSGPVTNGSVVATENSVTTTSAGVTFQQRVGTATYNPGTGDVTVSLPSSATSQTSISATGISTTGMVSANGFNANGNRITNVAAGVDATDAVNLGQLNTAIGTVNARVDGLAASLSEIDDRANAGTAVAVALSGGTFLPGKRFNLTANVGGYRGEEAIAAQVGMLVSENIALNAGVATGLSSNGGTAWRGGVSFGF